MVAYVLIPTLQFNEHREALLERARKDSSYGCFQVLGDEAVIAFACDASAGLFWGYCLKIGIQGHYLEIDGVRMHPEVDIPPSLTDDNP
jgi:hypothetical protein